MAEQTTEKTTEKTTKSKKGLIIGIVIAAAVLIAAIIAIVVINPFKKVNLVGTYDLTSMEVNGEDQSSSLSLMKAFGLSATIEIANDKEGKISMFGDEVKFTYDKSKFHFEKTEDQDAPTDADYTFKDDIITLIYTVESSEPDDAETLLPSESKTSTEKLIFTKQKED